MNKETERKIEEAYQHIRPYISKEETPELFDMCKVCECWCGNKHDYNECRNKPCFKFWLAYEYLKWSDSYN